MEAEFWQNLETELEIGSEQQLPFVSIKYGDLVSYSVPADRGRKEFVAIIADIRGIFPNFSLPPTLKGEPTLILVSLFLPEELQRKGVGSKIIDILEKRATREGKRFALGPVTSDEMAALCQKLKLTSCAPFSFYRAQQQRTSI